LDISLDTSEQKYWVAFSRVPYIGRARIQLLLHRFGSLGDAWNASSAALKEAGVDARTVASLAATRSNLDPDAEMERLGRLGVRAITWEDQEYPRLLKEVYDLPPVL